jgi:hypothetical protein
VPRTTAGREVDEGIDEWGPGVDERKGEKRGARVRLRRALGCCHCGACWASPRGREEGKGRVEQAAAGRKGRGGDNEPVGLLSISISFSFSQPSYGLFKLVFEFKLDMQICSEYHHMSSKSSKH